MTQVIWKFRLDPWANALDIDPEFKPLHVGLDPERKPCMWAMVDPSAAREECPVHIIPTGMGPESGVTKHVGTFIVDEFVGHVFVKGG